MSLQDAFNRLSPREQKLLGVFGALLGLLVLLGIPFYVFTSVASARDTNQQIEDLLGKMNRSREALAERKQVRDRLQRRYDRPAPALASFIEKAAQQHGLEVPESKDRPEIPRGKKYTERVTVVKMRKIGLLALVKTLERIVGSGHPVSISRLSIKKRTGKPDMFDVELGVSAYDRKETGKKKTGEDDKGKAPDAGVKEKGAGVKEKGQQL